MPQGIPEKINRTLVINENGEQMKRRPLRSSCIRSAGYDLESGILELEFPTGAVYRYSGVPGEVYGALVRSPEPGRFYNRNIKGSYPSELVERRKEPRYYPFLKKDIEFGAKLAGVVAGASVPLGLIALIAWIAGLDNVLGLAGGLLIILWGVLFGWAAFGGHSRGR